MGHYGMLISAPYFTICLKETYMIQRISITKVEMTNEGTAYDALAEAKSLVPLHFLYSFVSW